MSIAYLDPGNIESDLQSGATAGYKVQCVANIFLEMTCVRVSDLLFPQFILKWLDTIS